MKKANILKEIGLKLRQVRLSEGYSQQEMADRIRAYSTSYSRYENGETAPQITSLYELGTTFGVSLDWLICSKGAMYDRTKGEVKEQDEAEKEKTAVPETVLQEDIRQLVEQMERTPLLRYEVLTLFYKFKENHPGEK